MLYFAFPYKTNSTAATTCTLCGPIFLTTVATFASTTLFLFYQFTDYHVVADGYGGKGFLLSDSSTPEIDATLTKAQETASGGKAVLINALIGKTDFRQGPISV